jgi:hypothetical protein
MGQRMNFEKNAGRDLKKPLASFLKISKALI